MNLVTAYNIGDRVTIDRSIVGTITAVMVRGMGLSICYEVSYVHCGSSYSVWIETWRITPWEE